jgi:hypothetical protein
VAFVLILFSLLYNFLLAGAMEMFIHDLSDSFRGFSRLIGDSKLCILYPRFSNGWNIFYLLTWVYLRILMLPFCFIDSHLNSLPSIESPWRMVYPQHICLLILNCAIFFIQCFWFFMIFTSVREEKEKN